LHRSCSTLFPYTTLYRSEGPRFDRVQHLFLAATTLLNARGISIKHLKDRQWLLLSGEFLRHVQGWREGHHRVETHVVFTTKGAGDRKSTRLNSSHRTYSY